MLKALEIAWLCIAIFTLGVAGWQFMTDDASSAVFMLVGTAIATAMFLIRRRQRRNFDKYRQEKENPS